MKNCIHSCLWANNLEFRYPAHVQHSRYLLQHVHFVCLAAWACHDMCIVLPT